VECERLQGFPDSWTEFGSYDGIVKKIPKTQRYKLLGNAVTVAVVQMIGVRLLDEFASFDKKE
jgi:DNA (cytosine-5)-methyltransferase 1